MEIRRIEYGSAEWAEARELRYSVFFQEFRLPFSIVEDEQEAHAMHLVAVEGGKVVGYGRLFSGEKGKFHISQMVVAPTRQGRGIGRKLLQSVVTEAWNAGAVAIELYARTSAAHFYEKEGFVRCGAEFPSKKTGIPHVTMRLKNGPTMSSSEPVNS